MELDDHFLKKTFNGHFQKPLNQGCIKLIFPTLTWSGEEINGKIYQFLQIKINQINICVCVCVCVCV